MIIGIARLAPAHDGVSVGHAAAKSRRSVRRTVRRRPRAACSWAIAAGAFHTDDRTLTHAALGVAAVDLLRARFQEPPARRLGPLLHRAVLPRRGDRARRRPPALLRMPAQGRGGVCRMLAAGVPAARRGRAPPRWTSVLHAERLDGRAKRLHRRKIDDLPDGAFVALEERRLRGARRLAAALDAAGLRRPQAAAARHHGRRADAARDPRACSRPATGRVGIRARSD